MSNFVVSNRWFISFLVASITIKYAAQAIIIPILVSFYPSIYFILVLINIEFNIIFGIAYFILRRKTINREKHYDRNDNLTIVWSGIFNALTGLAMIYAADQNRTPVILQTIIAGMPIIPTVFLRKLFLNKIITYDKKYIIFSLTALFISLAISSIPIFRTFHFRQLAWSILYVSGICFLSTYNVMQEKYMDQTLDNSFFNKIRLMFFARLTEFIIILSLFWLEKFAGTSENPVKAFFDSFVLLGTDYKFNLLLHAFIISYIFAYILCVYLNSISANYNMLIPAISNPLAALFFTIFRKYNIGIQYPLYIVFPSIACSIASILLWIKGEKQYEGYQMIN